MFDSTSSKNDVTATNTYNLPKTNNKCCKVWSGRKINLYG